MATKKKQKAQRTCYSGHFKEVQGQHCSQEI